MCVYGMIWPFLSHFDMFQSNISLFFNNRIKRSSKIGFILTLILIIILSCFFSQTDMFLKKSPFVVSQRITNIHAPPVRFDQNHVLVLNLNDDNNTNFYDPSIFTMTYTIYHLKVDANGTFREIDHRVLDLILCQEKPLTDISLFESLGLKDALCLTNDTFEVEGYWDENEVYYAQAELYLCDNMTSNITCKSPEEIAYFFTSTAKYFGAVMHGMSLKIDDYEHPIKTKVDYFFNLMDLDFRKTMTIYLKNFELITHDGYFMQSTTVQTNFLKDYLTTDVGMRRSQKEVVGQIVLYASHDLDQNARRYQSLTEVLAYMAGLANFYILICSLVTNIQNYLQSLKIILNYLYFFPKLYKNQEYPLHDNKKTNKSKIEPKKLKPKVNVKEKDMMTLEHKRADSIEVPQSYVNFKMIHLDSPVTQDRGNIFTIERNQIFSQASPTGEIHLFPNKKERDLLEKCTNLKVGFWEFIRYLFAMTLRCKKSMKQKLIEKSDAIFMKEFDVINILKKLHEIEKLKLILLNEDQLILFNSLSKPMIYMEDEPEMVKKYEGNSALKMSNYIKNYKDIKRKTKFDNSYENVLLSCNFNQLNKRLLDLVDQNIENFKKI